MFIRDYKSKIIKGIDEDDLLEGKETGHSAEGGAPAPEAGRRSPCVLSLHSGASTSLLAT
jgi:hypothetical protein